MTSQHLEKLVRWFDQERELLRSKGIDDPDPRVVMEAVMRRHLAEIKSDPALVVAILTQATVCNSRIVFASLIAPSCSPGFRNRSVQAAPKLKLCCVLQLILRSNKSPLP